MTIQARNPDFIKRLVIKALVSDDYLMETLILKGGNALLVMYELSYRGSLDIDMSMDSDFQDIDKVSNTIKDNLSQAFDDEGLYVFGYKFSPRPKKPNEQTQDFWGGYKIEFKIIENEKADELGRTNFILLNNYALSIKPNLSPKIDIEISKYEYVGDIQKMDLDGFTVSVYAPRLLVFEKVRAICQQVPEYSKIIPSFSPRLRARDFYDIYIILQHFDIDINSNESKDIIGKVFEAKRVPMDLLKSIRKTREFHRNDFDSVRDTISPAELDGLLDFDFYFDFVLDVFEDYWD